MGIIAALISVALIMYLVRKQINTGLAMLAGALSLILLAPIPFSQALAAVRSALVSPTTWTLTLAVVLIGILGNILKASGAMALLLDKLVRLSGNPRWPLLLVPGLIGSLSVPGGAMMSAPMVGQLGEKMGTSPEHQTGVNIVFRHLWYVVFPVLPSLVMAAGLAGVTPLTLAAQNLWVAAAGAVFAWFYLLAGVKSPEGAREQACFRWADVARVFIALMPLLVVLVLFLAADLYFPLALVAGIAVALMIFPGKAGVGKTCTKRLCSMVLPGIQFSLLLVVPGVMIYKEVLEASGLLSDFAAQLVALGVPLWLLLTFFPLAIGLLTGSHEAVVGIAMPVFVPLLPQEAFLPALGLLYASCTLGYIISPLHLCLILTREYFGSRLGGVFRHTVPVAAVMLVTALVVALIRGM